LIWLIHFVRWTELKVNKRQHLAFHIHVLVLSLFDSRLFCWPLRRCCCLYLSVAVVSVCVSLFISVSRLRILIACSVTIDLYCLYLRLSLFIFISLSLSTYGLQCHDWFVLHLYAAGRKRLLLTLLTLIWYHWLVLKLNQSPSFLLFIVHYGKCTHTIIEHILPGFSLFSIT